LWVAVAAALLLAGAAALAANNLAYPGMWWDEAAQFWVSQGLSNYSEPFAARRGLLDVRIRNLSENLDPGGFSVLLHLWTGGSRSIEHLRALPFAFFLTATALLATLGWRLTRSALFALAAGSVLWLYPAARYFAFEVRAYSMEMAGVTAAALGLTLVVERPSTRRALLLGVVLAFFLTSRYSAVLAALACGGALWLGIARRHGWKAASRSLLATWLPVAGVGALVVWVTLRHQLWGEMRSGLLGVSAPAYTLASTPGHGGDLLGLLARNLLSPAALPITVCLGFVALARRRLSRAMVGGGAGADDGSPREALPALYALVGGILGLSAAAGLAGAYPWDMASRWSAYLVAVSALAVVVLASDAVRGWRTAGRRSSGGGTPRVRALGAGLALVVVGVAAGQAATYRQHPWEPHHTDIAPQLEALPASALPDASVLVSFYEVPVVRYLYEHGPLAGRPGYPEIFRFESGKEWSRRGPFADGDHLAFVVTARSRAEMQARFPAAVLRYLGPASGGLLVVTRVDSPAAEVR